ncbi:deleted in malignant brain tumors 1 protein-like [Strongylocentrotus purpuratus]|uniref:SRCR domain-containing protein n=1 Tax=Strongylocentrotus purpuratus TaxID=7668 RepID=A0A7M7SUS8_STRPU|nr:deleted in malignant brain tumors 1 protein-like [Strongylocentrotus purpuratus]
MASNTDRKLVRRMRLWIIFSAFVVFWPNYVRCQFEGDVRLGDVAQNGRGRVEIYHDNQWGTICDDTWDNSDAQVVCRQLGIGTTNARGYTATSPGSGPIHLDGTYCVGTEYRLDSCSHSSWGQHNCIHSEDAAVECEINEGDVRIVDGSTPNQGRVEIYHNYLWGTVCDDSWDDSDARVVCRQLGYSGDVGEARSGGTYGRGSDPTYLDEVGCSGYESRLEYCSHAGWGIEDCSHSEDAGVYCYDNNDMFDVLKNLEEKEKEVIHLKETIVHQQHDINRMESAINAMEQYSRRSNIRIFGLQEKKGENTDALVADVITRKLGVTLDPVRDLDRTHRTGRLHDNSEPSAPGTSLTDASSARKARSRPIIVKLTTYRKRREVIYNRKKLKGTGIVIVEDLTVENQKLLSATRKTSGVTAAWSSDGRIIALINATGVVNIYIEKLFTFVNFLFFYNSIEDPDEGNVRLAGGSTPNQGRVEIYHNSLWGTVCDDSWDDSDARVVCRQLGYSGDVGEARSGGTYGRGSDPTYLDEVGCSGYESRLEYCSHAGWGIEDCSHSEDAGVYCNDNDNDLEGDVRLVDGYSLDEGRVEIFHEGQWGTVCDDSWSDSDARVVCRQLGYSGDVGVAQSGGTYGRGSDPIFLDEVTCTGYETRLKYCSHQGWGNEDCDHSEDAGVQCRSPAPSSRVVGIMSFVGVSLSLLTLFALVVVCYTCSQRKPVVIPTSSVQVPLSTISSHPAANNTPAAPTSNGMISVPTEPPMPQQPPNPYPPATETDSLPQQPPNPYPPASQTDSLPGPPSYYALQGGQSDPLPPPN